MAKLTLVENKGDPVGPAVWDFSEDFVAPASSKAKLVWSGIGLDRFLRLTRSNGKSEPAMLHLLREGPVDVIPDILDEDGAPFAQTWCNRSIRAYWADPSDLEGVSVTLCVRCSSTVTTAKVPIVALCEECNSLQSLPVTDPDDHDCYGNAERLSLALDYSDACPECATGKQYLAVTGTIDGYALHCTYRCPEGHEWEKWYDDRRYEIYDFAFLFR